MREKKTTWLPWLLGFLVVASPWLMAAGGWTDVVTNFMATRLDPNMRGSSATDQYVPTYDHPSRSYILKAGSGGGGGVATFVPGAGISGAIVGTTLGVSNTGVLSVTAGTNVTIGGTASAPVINASVSGSGVNGTVNGAGSTALTTVNVTGTLLGAKGSISGSTLNVSLDLIATGDVAAANKDGLAAVPSMRTLGTGAQQSPPGNDARFPPAPSNANNIVRDTGTAYATVTAGGNSTALTVSSGGALGFSQITNAMILNAAGIPYSKLTLTASILVGDLANKTGTGTNVVTDAGASIGMPNFVFGSDAAGDIPIRGASTYGVLAKGASNTVLRINSSGVQQYGAVTDAMLVSVFVNTVDTRVLPTPSGAGKLPYDNGTNYVELAAGTSSQVLSGGATPSWVSFVNSIVAGTAISISGATGAVTVNNTGVTSAVAGTGIGVSAGTGAVTISNSGVTSNVAGTGITVSGATGAVTIGNGGVTSIVAGTGVTISGATGAVTVNAFGPAKFRIAMMPGAAEITGATSDPLLIGTKGTNSSWSYLAYNDTTVMDGRWVNGGSIVNDYAGGAITLRIRWYATATTGNVVWTVKTLARAAGSVMDTAYDATNAHTVTTAAAGTTLQLVNSDITWTPIAGELTAGSIFMVQAERTASSGSDTMTGDANVVSVTATEN